MIEKYFQNHIKRNFSIATIWIDGGSNMDFENKKGLNQILCSMLTRGCEGFDNFKLSDYIESYGAELTSEVFEDGMLISIKSLNIYFEKIYPLMDLMINKPILSEMQFQIVKNSTLNLIKKEKENPFNICFEKWRKVVYFKHPYAFNSYGYEEDLVNIFFEDVLSEFERFKSRKKYLISNNNKIVEDNLKIKNQKIPNLKSSSLKHDLNQKERFVSSFNLSDQTIIMLGNQTCPRESNEYLQLKLLESYLSFGMSSALFKLFREKNGITYDVGVYNSVKKDNAPFLVYLSVSNKNALFAFNLLIKFWKELLNSRISNEELNLAKEKLKSSYLIKSQSIDEILQKNIQLISYGIPINSDKDYFLEIDNVSSKDIIKITNKYFSNPILSINCNQKISNEIEKEWINEFSG